MTQEDCELFVRTVTSVSAQLSVCSFCICKCSPIVRVSNREGGTEISPASQTEFPLASSPGHSQILFRSRGEKSGEGLGAKLRHGPEMVDSVST